MLTHFKSQITSFFLLLFLFAGTTSATEQRIGILVFDGVLTSDVTAPLEVFGTASKLSWFKNYTPITIALTDQKTITTEEGLIMGANTWIGDMPDVDVLIVPSSYDMKPLLKNKSLINFIKQTAEHARWVSSNCSGAFLLAESGLLKGKKATTYAGGEGELQRSFPDIAVQIDTNVVVDGNVITSNGGIVSYQAALHLLRLMTSEKNAREVADALQYTRLSTQPF